MMQVQQEASNQRLMLEQWAANNASTIQGLKSNLAQVSANVPTGINQPGLAGNIQVDAAGNINQAYNPGNTIASNTTQNSDYLKQLGLA
jgi:hypothetical protein